jgi:hypothetical protein
MHDKLTFLHGQLDSLKGQEILSGLVLQDGSSNRLVGGTSPLPLFLSVSLPDPEHGQAYCI